MIDIKSTLNDLAQKGIRGRLITSNYLDFNQPKVFKELLKLPNVDVRIINENGFHTKAYSFNHGDYTSVIIGSANLTQTALKKNFEWNFLRVTSTGADVKIMDRLFRHRELPDSENFPKPGFQLKTA